MTFQTSIPVKLGEARRLRVRDVPLLVFALAAAGLFLGLDTLLAPGHLAGVFTDSDDATRMVQIREFMAGAPWFDTTLPRIGAPDALVSHWSRLIDLPLSLLIFAFALIFSPATAELLARVVWPLGLFVILVWMLGRAAEFRSGRIGALIALLLAVLCFSGTSQFVPGRIDHHNVLILCALSGVLLLARSFQFPQTGWVAGSVLGFGVAVGYEALPFTAVCLGGAGLLAAWTERGATEIARAGLGFASMLATAFVLTIAPGDWGVVRCDALSANLVVLAMVSSAGLAGALLLARSLRARLAIMGAAGAAGLALYGAMEPACLAGPFGQVAPGVWPIWLDHVSETQGLSWLAANLPAAAIAFVIHTGLGLVAAFAIARRDRDPGAVFYAFVLIVATVLSLLQTRLMPYAAFLSVPPLAIAIARMRNGRSVRAAVRRAVAVAGLNQQTLLIGAALIAGTGNADFLARMRIRTTCLAAESITPLGAFPKGLVAADTDLGPFIVAFTPHSVVSAPYHRLGGSIDQMHHILYAPPAEARDLLLRLNADYVAYCSGYSTTTYQGTPPADALMAGLIAGHIPDFLERVATAGSTPLQVWRIKER